MQIEDEQNEIINYPSFSNCGMMTMDPASIYQLLKGPRVAVQKGIDNPNPRNPTNSNDDSKSNELISENNNTCCDLCDVVLTTTPLGGRHLSSREQELLTDLLRRTEGLIGHQSVPAVGMTILCPSCGQGMCSLLSLGRRVRRMEEELRDKIQTLLSIMRWKEGRKGKGFCDLGSLEPEDENIFIERPPDEDSNVEGSIKGELEFEDPHYYVHPNDDEDLEYTDDDNDDRENDEFLRKQNEKEEAMKDDGAIAITTTNGIDQAMNPVEELQDLDFTDYDEEESDEVLQSEDIFDGSGFCSPVVTRPPEDNHAPNYNGDNRVVDNSNYTSWKEAHVKRESGEILVPMDVEDMDMEEMENPNEDHQFEEGYRVEETHDKVLTMPQCNNDKELECSRPQSFPLRRLERKSKTKALQILKSHTSPEISSQFEEESDQEHDGQEEGYSTCSGSDSDCESDAGSIVGSANTRGGRKHICIPCNKKFFDLHTYRRHTFSLTHRHKENVSQNNGEREGKLVSELPEHNDLLSKEGPPFLCACGKSFQLKRDRDTHYHFGNCEIKCYTCKKRFSTKKERDQHGLNFGHKVAVKLEQRDQYRYRCDLCNMQFKWKQYYQSHLGSMRHRRNIKKRDRLALPANPKPTRRGTVVRSNPNSEGRKNNEEEGPPFICVCGKSFSAKHRKNFHFRIVHLNKDVPQCIPCGRTFATTESLRYHVTSIIHKQKAMNEEGVETLPNNDPKHICETCGKGFYNTVGFRYHRNNAHIIGEGNEVCETCGKKFKNKNALKRHTQNHIRPHVCDRCGKRFNEKYRLREHMLGVHEADNAPRINCPHCEKKFRKKEQLRKHINQWHGPLGADARFHCSQCNQNFKTVQDRTVHDRSVHKGLENYKCDYCDKMFPVKLFLEQHIVTHTGIKLDRYTCQKCGKKFRDSYKFRSHRIIVCGDDEEAKKALQLKRAETQRRMRAKKPYKCPECGVGYGQKAQLISHRKREHGVTQR